MCGKLFLKNSEDKTQVDSVDTTWHIIRNYPWTWQTFLLHKYSKLKRQTIQCLPTCRLNPQAALISNIQKSISILTFRPSLLFNYKTRPSLYPNICYFKISFVGPYIRSFLSSDRPCYCCRIICVEEKFVKFMDNF